MADIFPVAGARIYIGPATETKKVDFTEADFPATEAAWTEIDGWQTMGGFGDTAAEISGSLINRKRDYRLKGTRNAGNMENVFAIIQDDPGQIAARAAEKTNDNYAFRIVYEDGTEHMFIGLVMSANQAGGEANTIANLNVNIGINSNIVEVAA